MHPWSAKREPPLRKGALGRSRATAPNYNLNTKEN